MMSWLRSSDIYINEHGLKTNQTCNIGFLTMCNTEEKLWPDVQKAVFNAAATTHCDYINKNPNKTDLTTMMPPIELIK